MNLDSSFPPMLPPSTELSALLFAVLPCLQETYRPLASFAYHMTELTKLKNIPAVPSFTGLSGIEALITDKDIMLRSLTFYGKMFRMPLLSTIATLLQGFQFYQTYKDILPGLFSGMAGSGKDASAFGNMAGLFSGLGGLGGFGGTNTSDASANNGSDLFSMLGGLSPDLLSSLFSGFSGGFTPYKESSSASSPKKDTETAETVPEENATSSHTPNDEPSPTVSVSPSIEASPMDSPDKSLSETPMEVTETNPAKATGVATSPPPVETTEDTASDALFNNLYTYLTPEQQKIYEQLMHTD